MHVDAAPCAAALQPDLVFHDVAALRAAHNLAIAGHVDRLRRLARDAPRARRSARFPLVARCLRFRLLIAVGVLITALAVFSIAHIRWTMFACKGCRCHLNSTMRKM